jgi:hypothetical protein
MFNGATEPCLELNEYTEPDALDPADLVGVVCSTGSVLLRFGES